MEGESSCGDAQLAGYLIVSWDKTPKKSRWVIFQAENCKLCMYKTEFDQVPLKEIDICRAVFLYDADRGDSGQFCIKSGANTVHVETGCSRSRDNWLKQLRQERKNYNCKCKYLQENGAQSLASRSHSELPIMWKKSNSKTVDHVDNSRESDLEEVVLRHPPSGSKSPTSPASPTSKSPPVFRLSSPKESNDGAHPSLNTFSSLGKRIRHSFRERKRNSRQGNDASRRKSDPSTKDCDGCNQLSSQLVVVQEDLKATEDEFEASRKVIEILQDQVEVLSRENKTLLELSKRTLKKDDYEMLGILKEKEIALIKLENQCRKLGMQEEKLEVKVERLQDDSALYKELLQAKDRAIIELTNEIHDMKATGEKKCTKSTQTICETEDLQETVEALSLQNKFLNEELVETSQLLQQSAQREEKLLVESSEWEARFYQIQSKYMLILNELQAPEVNQNPQKFRELVAQFVGDCVTGATPSLRSSNKTFDVYGFQQTEASISAHQELSTSQLEQWNEVVAMLEREDLHNIAGLKGLIRLGIPCQYRGTIWKGVMDYHLRGTRKFTEPELYRTVLHLTSRAHISPAAKQIETDLLRTLPNNRHYEGMHADGIPKLRRVLLAYSVYNPEVGYCQGLNRLVAIMLLFLTEEEAFWGLVYIVEKLLPPDYYGQQLSGAQADQRVLKDLIAEKMPRLSSHLTRYHVDISLVTLNWFLCIFVDSLQVELFMRVWDAFWYEGSKVLFRYALAALKLNETAVLKQKECVAILTTLKNEVECLTDAQELTRVAFEELNPFPMRMINQKREHFKKIIKVELADLEAVRQEYQRRSRELPDANGNN